MTDEVAGPPEVFIQFRNLVRIHLRQMMQLNRKPPMHAVALLVMIAYEALTSLNSRGAPEEFFADHLSRRRNLPKAVGRLLYKSLRDGLAHLYGPNPIMVEGIGEVMPVLLWKDDEHHLKPATVDFFDVNGALHLRAFEVGEPAIIAVDVDTLRTDLDALFSEIEEQLRVDASARNRITQNAARLRNRWSESAQGMSIGVWREFLGVLPLPER